MPLNSYTIKCALENIAKKIKHYEARNINEKTQCYAECMRKQDLLFNALEENEKGGM